MTSPLRLSIDLPALAANWRWFDARSGAAETGAAVKADGYGLGAAAVIARLAEEGCRDFYMTTYDEIAAAGPMPPGCTAYALHGFRQGDDPRTPVVPMLNSAQQIAHWRQAAPGQACDVMVDTGMNRLGIGWREFTADLLDGLNLRTLHSHLACSDEPDSPMNAEQRARFAGIVEAVRPARAALSGSGGACLGEAYRFGAIRPGLGLYGGVPHPAAAGQLASVAAPAAEILQVRSVAAGESAGYNACWTATHPTRLATVNIGYADGYLRAFSSCGEMLVQGRRCRVAGRISMDLTIVDIGDTDARPGDWATLVYSLADAARISGLSQYELLTGLGRRYQRRYL